MFKSHYNNNINRIQPSFSMKAGLVDSNKRTTNLAIGVPDIACPQEILDILHDGITANRTSYGPSKGSNKALTNIKSLLFADEPQIDPEKNLTLVSGAKYGIYLSLKTICNPGESVILMQPYWLSYPEIITSLDLDYCSWMPEIDMGGNTTYHFDDLISLLKNKQVKALILNNPNNPSGKLFELNWITELNNILINNNVWLIIDEVYRNLLYKPNYNNFQIFDDNIIRIGSFSKSLSIPGLRLGYICATRQFIDNFNLYNQHIQTCVNSLSAYLAENIDNNIFNAFAANCAQLYKERFEVVYNKFSLSHITVLHCDASFYTFVDLGKFFSNGEMACDFLYRQLGIIAVHGLPYGSMFGTYIRICLTLPADVLGEKIDLILNSLPDEHF